MVTANGNIKGIILRSQLLVLLNNKYAFVKDNETNRYLAEDQGLVLKEVDDATAIVLIQQEQTVSKPKIVKEAQSQPGMHSNVSEEHENEQSSDSTNDHGKKKSMSS